MIGRDDHAALREKVDYLEGKCAFLIERIEELLRYASTESVSKKSGVPADLEGEVLRLRIENDELKKRITHPEYESELSRLRVENVELRNKLALLRDSVSWRVTKPIRAVSVPMIDRWIKGRDRG